MAHSSTAAATGIDLTLAYFSAYMLPNIYTIKGMVEIFVGVNTEK